MAMDGYEPASGFNLPPGCSEADVDRAMGYGEAAPCGECAEAVDVCCDYCVCGRELPSGRRLTPAPRRERPSSGRATTCGTCRRTGAGDGSSRAGAGEGGADMDAAQVAERLRRIKEEGISWSSLTEAVLGRPALRAEAVERLAELLEGAAR